MKDRYVPLSFFFYCIAIAMLVGFILGKLDIQLKLRDELIKKRSDDATNTN